MRGAASETVRQGETLSHAAVAAASSPRITAIGRESVTMHVLLCRMH